MSTQDLSSEMNFLASQSSKNSQNSELIKKNQETTEDNEKSDTPGKNEPIERNKADCTPEIGKKEEMTEAEKELLMSEPIKDKNFYHRPH